MDDKSIGQVIADARKSQGLGRYDLGRRVGVSETTISLWESGDRKPEWDRCAKIAEALNLDARELILRSFRREYAQAYRVMVPDGAAEEICILLGRLAADKRTLVAEIVRSFSENKS